MKILKELSSVWFWTKELRLQMQDFLELLTLIIQVPLQILIEIIKPAQIKRIQGFYSLRYHVLIAKFQASVSQMIQRQLSTHSDACIFNSGK